VTHAVRIVREMHRRHPDVSYDVTIKVEHLLRNARHLAALTDIGCLFLTTAVESFDNEVLRRLAKGHTAADFGRALGLFRQHGLAVHPTFIPFHPWTTLVTMGRSANASPATTSSPAWHDWADSAEAAGGVPHLLEPWFCCAEPPAVRLGAPAAALN